MAGHCHLILATICLLQCQVLAVQREKSEAVDFKKWTSNNLTGFVRSGTPLLFNVSVRKKSLLPSSDGLSSALSDFKDATITSVDSHELPHQNSRQPLTYEHHSERKKTSRKDTHNGGKNIMYQSHSVKSTQGAGANRFKRFASRNKRSDNSNTWEDDKASTKRNDSDSQAVGNKIKEMTHESELSFDNDNDLPSLSPNEGINEVKSTNKDKMDGIINAEADSSDSSSSPVVFILPAILGFLIISLLISLLMYRNLRKKAGTSSPENESQLPSERAQYFPGKVQSPSEIGKDSIRGADEAVELVDLVEYHPAKARELMAGHVYERDRESNEPLMLYHQRSRLEEADFDLPEIKYRRNYIKDTRDEERASKKTNKDLIRQISPNSGPDQEEDRGSFEKIYISLPPRPPSDNYIEATSTSTSVSSTKSINTTKLEWLTKNIAVDAKNEHSYYQSEISTQTDSSVEPLFSKTVFGTPWQFGGTFTRRGGVLQPELSDVSLTLVPNAVLSKDYVDVYGAVFTETQEICKKFGIPLNEILVTPVVEYHTPRNYQFSHHVRINLPHALPEDSDVKSLKVYGFSVDERGQVSVRLVSPRKQGNACWDQDSFWEFKSNDQSIQIWTLHFSGYFCTSCESKSSMSSVCARVFGSHVQIKSKRREIRIILYIWDRRLNIRDFLQRIIEQESDMDRQLLADQQIPLPENATSDSHVIMKMDTLGDEEDRSCWRHVMRPNSGRPLFRPLQVRRLFQIIQCCQQTDPLRVEWAMENVPSTVPSSVFQCCIDMVHVPESTTNFEQALEDADEDYMRTFYVRDLTLAGGHSQNQCSCDQQESAESKRLYLKQALSELNQQETESVCEALGLARKDIGNLCKKFPSEESVKYGLIEECCRRIGQERFSHCLPEVLKQMGFTHVLDVLEKRQQLSPGQHGLSQTSMKMINNLDKNTDSIRNVTESLESNTEPKNFSSYLSDRNGNSKEYRGFQKQISEQSNEVFFVEDNPSNHYGRHQFNVQVRYPQDTNGNHNTNFSRPYSQSQRYSVQRKPDGRQLSSQSFSHRSDLGPSHASQHHEVQREKYPAGQKSSSSGSDSVLKGNSINSSDIAMSSLDYVSMEAQADSKEFQQKDEKEELEEFEEETFKKETAPAEQGQIRRGFPDIEEETRTSRHGPAALSYHANNNSRLQSPPSNHFDRNSPSDDQSNRSGQRNNQQSRRSHDIDQTFCKESCETIV